jgi:deoxyribodipyrimidine photolyase
VLGAAVDGKVQTAIALFTRDLRVHDNPALAAAVESVRVTGRTSMVLGSATEGK